MKNYIDQNDKTLDQDNKGNLSRSKSKFDLDQILFSKIYSDQKMMLTDKTILLIKILLKTYSVQN